MTWTRAFRKGSGFLLRNIVNGLPSPVSPPNADTDNNTLSLSQRSATSGPT